MAGIYIHIPFCKTKCGYCDFYSSTRPGLRDAVMEEILRELEAERPFIGTAPVRTIYFGGGTPSVCQPAQLQRIIGKISELWDCTGVEEVTAEANPDDLTDEYLSELASTRIDRLSIGVQSFVDRDLRFMNRRHSARAAVEAVRDAQRNGFGNISIDLIYGIPGMGIEEWRANVETAVSLGVQHVSAYHLTIEEGTPFGWRAAAGRLQAVDENDSEEQFALLHRVLKRAGFEHYEVSNFAKPGFRARHNGSYWTGEPYLGVGPSAHSFNGTVRRSNALSVEEYITARSSGYVTETLTDTDRFNELVMTSLRTADGLAEADLERVSGRERAERFAGAARRYLRSGTLVRAGGRYFIPPEKFLVSDSVIAGLFQ